MRLVLEDGVLDLDTGTVQRGALRQRLTGKELETLRYLVRHAGRPVTLDELHAEVWEHAAQVVSRAAYHTLSRLRRKLEPDPSHPTLILSTYGDGYVWMGDTGEALVGRQHALVELRRRLAADRRVWVHGQAGVGKSALARAVHQGGPWCDLAGAGDDDDLWHALAHALGVEADVVDGPSVCDVLASLADRVLVLDHVDGVLESVRRWLANWASGAGPRLLITSRSPIGVPAPLAFEVGRLGPGPSWALAQRVAGAAGRSASGAERLGGVPLAIALVVATGARPSGRGLGAALAAVRHALPDPARQVLVQCAAFRGRFTAVRAMHRVELEGGGDVPAALDVLVAVGALERQVDGDVVWLRVPEALREAAADPHEGSALALARAFTRGTAHRAEVLDLWAAARAAVAATDGALAAGLVLALCALPRGSVGTRALRRLIDVVLALPGAGPLEPLVWVERARLPARAPDPAGAFDVWLGRPHPPRTEGLLLEVAARAAGARGDLDRGAAYLHRARVRLETLGDPAPLARLAVLEARWLLDADRPAEAIAVLAEATPCPCRAGLEVEAWWGRACVLGGRSTDAEARLTGALHRAVALGDLRWSGRLRLWLGGLALASGDRDGAREHASVARRRHRRVGWRGDADAIDALIRAAGSERRSSTGGLG